MLEIICFFGPACIAMLIFTSVNKEKEITVCHYLVQYGVYVTLINGITFLLIGLVFGHLEEVVNISQSSIEFIIKYLTIGIVLAVVLSAAYIIRLKVGFKLEVKNKEISKEK